MLFGYARVSTADQNPAHQIDALIRAGVESDNIYLDTTSGAKASRPQLDVLLKVLRRGDTLKITRLDRLGRSVLHLVTLGAELRERESACTYSSRASTPPPPRAGPCSACCRCWPSCSES